MCESCLFPAYLIGVFVLMSDGFVKYKIIMIYTDKQGAVGSDSLPLSDSYMLIGGCRSLERVQYPHAMNETCVRTEFSADSATKRCCCYINTHKHNCFVVCSTPVARFPSAPSNRKSTQMDIEFSEQHLTNKNNKIIAVLFTLLFFPCGIAFYLD